MRMPAESVKSSVPESGLPGPALDLDGPGMSDADWLACFLEAECGRALVELEAECCRLARAIGRRMGFGPDELEDLGRDFYVHLADSSLRRLRAYRGRGNFGAWLARCCVHFLLNVRRYRHRRFVEVPLEPEHEGIAATGTEAAVENRAIERLARRQQRGRLNSALGSLSRAERDLLTLHYLGDLSHVEIAQRFGCSPAAVR